MSFRVTEPILVIGFGGLGAKIASRVQKILNSECLIISSDAVDFKSDCSSKQIITGPVVNPSIKLLRSFTYKELDEIKSKISGFSTVILIANLAGKNGSACAPVISNLCKNNEKNLISFAIMPFKFEKDRIFSSGVSLKRLKEDSSCTVVLDNDALLDSNPDLKIEDCYKISNKALEEVICSVKSTNLPEKTSILSVGKETKDIECSLRDSIRMLYEDAPPDAVKRSILYIVGGNNVPVRILNSVNTLASGILDEGNTEINYSIKSNGSSNVVMVTSVQGQTRFDKYDPLAIIPKDKTIDWEIPECSIDCPIDIYQLE